jgi:hypothetical protein
MASAATKVPMQRHAALERRVSTRYGTKMRGVTLIAAARPVATPRGTVFRPSLLAPTRSHTTRKVMSTST